MGCDEIKQFITDGCDDYTQAAILHNHIVECITCAAYKAQLLGLSIDEVLKAIHDKI
jgi:hypothetical protein